VAVMQGLDRMFEREGSQDTDDDHQVLAAELLERLGLGDFEMHGGPRKRNGTESIGTLSLWQSFPPAWAVGREKKADVSEVPAHASLQQPSAGLLYRAQVRRLQAHGC
jgi:hypothetical protein